MKHIKPEPLKKELLKKCKSLGIPLVGFAPVERWSSPPKELPNSLSPWIPEEFWPQSIYPEAKTVIVIGLPVSLPIVETAPSIYYHELYKTVNSMLDSKAYEISHRLWIRNSVRYEAQSSGMNTGLHAASVSKFVPQGRTGNCSVGRIWQYIQKIKSLRKTTGHGSM